MSSVCKQVSLITAFLALMFAQAYGLERGYASHHGISVIEREFEPDSRAGSCQQVMRCAVDSHKEHENHAPMTVDMEAGRGGIVLAALQLAPVELADLLVRDWITRQRLLEAEILNKASAETPEKTAPPVGIQVVRCMVMLI